MPMTLTEYWKALEKDVSGLKRELGQTFDYTTYAPVIAVEHMILAGKNIETTSWPGTLLEIKNIIETQEINIGDLPDDVDIPQAQKVRRPRLDSHQDFFFAVIYYFHQTRFADVVATTFMANSNVQSIQKPRVALNTPGLLRSINQYYDQHRDDLIAQFPQLATAADEAMIDKVNALIHPPRPFDALMADTIQREFTAIIEAGPDTVSIVTNLQAHFTEKERIITRMYTVKSLLDHLKQAGTRLANMDEQLFTAFLDLLPPVDREHWRVRILDAQTTPVEIDAEAVLPAPQTMTLRQSGADWIRWGWSLGTSLTEITGKLVEPWAPTMLTNVVQSVYEATTELTESAATLIANQFGALPPPLEPLDVTTQRDLSNLVRDIYESNAGQLITNDSDLTLEDAHLARPVMLLHLKEKLHVLNTVLVLDKQMEDFIRTHNKGLVRFIDFFRPINQFLSRTFFRSLLHDKALLLEEARQLKKSLGEMKQELDQTQDPAAIKAQLQARTDHANTSIAGVKASSRYLFLHPQMKADARAAADDLQQRITDTTASFSAPAA